MMMQMMVKMMKMVKKMMRKIKKMMREVNLMMVKMTMKIMLLHNGRLVECSINCMATMTIIVIAVVGTMMNIFLLLMMNWMMVKMTKNIMNAIAQRNCP